MKLLTRGAIIKSLNTAANITIEGSDKIIKFIVSTIAQELADGKTVTIKDLGKFEIKPHKGRKIRSVSTHEIMETRDYKNVIFSPCPKIKKALNPENPTKPTA
jgi:nucleoid DNA-binding protein